MILRWELLSHAWPEVYDFLPQELTIKGNPVCKISVAPHGSHLAALSQDGSVHILDMVTKERLLSLPHPASSREERYKDLKFLPNGHLLLLSEDGSSGFTRSVVF